MTKKRYVKVSLMLFSLFFGAGNLIFPPMAGKMAGSGMWLTMAFFAVTAVVLPVLGVLAVSETKGLQNLAGRVDPVFAGVFTVLIYLSIGPMLGIPRAGALPFEMSVAPYLPKTANMEVALFIYTLIFFGAAFLLSLEPGKLVERMGKVLTPTLLILIAILFLSGLFKEMPVSAPPVGNYKTAPAVQGFLDGYNTMDAVAALNFGFVIYLTLKDFGVTDEKEVSSVTGKCGVMSGSILLLIYFALAHLGAKSAVLFPETENGADILAAMSGYLLGSKGALILGVIFTLACLTTCVGLITSCSAYFTELFNGKLSYKTWTALWTLSSMLLANFGLDRILKYSVTILNVIYPVSIVLVILAMLNKRFESGRIVYRTTIYTVAIVSLLEVISTKVPLIRTICSYLPFEKYQMGWVLPAFISFVVSGICFKMTSSIERDVFPVKRRKKEMVKSID